MELAAQIGTSGEIKALVMAGADVNARDNMGYSPLAWAAYAGTVDTFYGLKAMGADQSVISNKGETVLMMAAKNPNPTILENLLMHWPRSELEAKDSDGETAFASAVHVGNAAPIEDFLKAGVEVDTRDKYDTTPLMWMATKGMWNDPLLIAAGADVNAKDSEGDRPLNWAAAGTDSPTQIKYQIDVLLDAGAKIDAEDNLGNTPLMDAALYKHPQAAAELLQRGANGALHNKKGQTAYDIAKTEKVFVGRPVLLWLRRLSGEK